MKRIYIPEGKQVGIIYHHTYNKAAIHMEGYTSEIMVRLLSSIIDKGLLSERFDYISFTRNFHLNSDDKLGDPWGAVRIVLDGDSMSDKHSINPFLDIYVGIDRSDEENEERIIWPKGKYLPISKYILGIDLIKLKGMDEKNEAIEAFMILKNKYPNIKFNIVDKYSRYR